MKRLIIIGASGHGRVVANVAKMCGYEDIAFLDGNLSITTCAGYPVLGPETLTDELTGDIFVAVGDSDARRKLTEKNSMHVFPVLIHPSAVVAEDVEIGSGTVVMAGAVINPGARIGKGCIINTSSSIDHDCYVGDFVHIAVGAHLAGTVDVGTCTWIGAGATVINNVSICPHVMIGAGAVVVKSIAEEGTYIGVPAKIMKKATKNKQGDILL